MKTALALLGLLLCLFSLGSALREAISLGPSPLTGVQSEQIKTAILAKERSSALPRPTILPIPIRCDLNRVVHTNGIVKYWPPIYKTLCSGYCTKGTCLPQSLRSVGVWRLAYRILYNPIRIVIDGYRYVRYQIHTGPCDCKGCHQYDTYRECQCNNGCPGFSADRLYKESFCHWNESSTDVATTSGYLQGECECCKVPRACPRGQAFSRAKCECACAPQLCKKPKIWNAKECKCECPIVCHPNFVLDESTCQCVCKRICLPGYSLDLKRCVCVRDPVADCSRIVDDKERCVNALCNSSSSLRCQYNDVQKCHCPCCQNWSQATPNLNYNCPSLTPHGVNRCNLVWTGTANGKQCDWVCPIP